MENNMVGFGDWPDEPEMFSGLPPSTMFDEKKAEVAADLAGLMAFKCMHQAELADNLSWKKSRLSTVLSGRSNLTLGKIWEFANTLGYDFDVIFRTHNERKALQPWSRCIAEFHQPAPQMSVALVYQTGKEVSRDFENGIYASSGYISLKDSRTYLVSVEETHRYNFILDAPEKSHNWIFDLDVDTVTGGANYE